MKVPFLDDDKIDSAASELLRKFSKKVAKAVRPPIPVDDIIEKFLSITLEITDLRAKLGSDVLGAAYFDDGVIRVDASLSEQEGRLSFTMGHEIGHWQLHRPLYEMEKVSGSLFSGKTDLPAFLCRSTQKPSAEIQADKFAARLLMPEQFVREAFKAAFGESPYLIPGLRDHRTTGTAIGPWSEVAKAVRSKGGFGNVSVEAMRYRLEDLKLVRDQRDTEAQPRLI